MRERSIPRGPGAWRRAAGARRRREQGRCRRGRPGRVPAAPPDGARGEAAADATTAAGDPPR